MAKRQFVSFDWAMKRLLRSKANFGILEGLLSELLGEQVKILEILESEGNREVWNLHTNRLDLKVRNSRRELVIIEIQYDREYDYFQRILFNTSKVITEHLDVGAAYGEVVKVISVNILYFDLGQGEDYLYHGQTIFRGIHRNDELVLSGRQRELFGKRHPADLFPEYYLIKVNNFDDVARNTLDEWIYFLKHEKIEDNFTAQGLKEAKRRLDIMKLSEAERRDYERYADDLHYQASMFESTYVVPFREGLEKGREEGATQERRKIAERLLAQGLTLEAVAGAMGLPLDEVISLLPSRLRESAAPHLPGPSSCPRRTRPTKRPKTP